MTRKYLGLLTILLVFLALPLPVWALGPQNGQTEVSGGRKLRPEMSIAEIPEGLILGLKRD